MSERPTPSLEREAFNMIIQSIESGVWPEGSRLPPERQLCAELDISRTTLRAALADVERRGLITRRQGRGTFVTRRPPSTDLGSYFSIGASLRARGRSLVSKVLSLDVVPATRQIATDLHLLPGDDVARLERLRSVDGEPLYLETTYLPLARFDGLTDFDLRSRSLYEVLDTEYGCRVQTANAEMSPVMLSPEEAALLDVGPTVPGMSLRRVTRDSQGAPVEVSEAILRGDRARFVQQLSYKSMGQDESQQLQFEPHQAASAR